jgi:Na+/proline symporter
MSNGPPAAAAAAQGRARLIDHFKRVFAIIAGLALTEACRRLLPAQPALVWPGPNLWMFITLCVTVIPIFHGGDRSLDFRHLEKGTKSLNRVYFLWDVYALLITALLFVCAAAAIPKVETLQDPPPGWTYAGAAAVFYTWLFVLFSFNVFVLLVDLLKSPSRGSLMPSYVLWIVINSVMIVASVIAFLCLNKHGDTSLEWVSPVYCFCAIGRTLIDYWQSDEVFMFPQI